MNIMGIDQSLGTTGIAIINDEHSFVCTETIKTDKVDSDLARCMDITNRVLRLCEIYKIKKVAFEGYAFTVRGNYSYRAGELGGILKYRLNEKMIEFKQVAIMAHKKKFTGSGKAKKEDIIFYAKKIFNIDVNEHEADALSIANFIVGEQNGS